MNVYDYAQDFGYLYFDAGKNGSLPAYVTKRPEKGTAIHPGPAPGSGAPDEGGTPFMGFTKEGTAKGVGNIEWWEKCPPGYRHSLTPPFKCVPGQQYYGFSTGGKTLGFIGLALLVIAGIYVYVKREEIFPGLVD